MKSIKAVFIVLGCLLIMGCPGDIKNKGKDGDQLGTPTQTDPVKAGDSCRVPSPTLIENDSSKYTPKQYEGAIFWGSKKTLVNSGIATDSIITCSCDTSLHMIITSNYDSIRAKFQGIVDPETCNNEGVCGGDIDIGDSNDSNRTNPTLPEFYTNRRLIMRNLIGTIPSIDNVDATGNEFRVPVFSLPQQNQGQVKIAILDSGLPTTDISLANAIPWFEGDLDLVDDTSSSPYFLIGSLQGDGRSERMKANILHGMLVQQTLQLSLDAYDIINEVNIIPIRISDFSGKFTLYNLLCGLYTAQKNGADIINTSLSMLTVEGYEINILKEHIKRITQNGISIVSAQGNDSSNIDCFGAFPAEYDSVYGVSSLSCMENVIDLAISSNYSVKNNLYAEFGHDIYNQDAKIIEASKSIFGSNDPEPISGTSFAAPKFAARLAYLKQNNLNLPTKPHHLGNNATGLMREGKSLNVFYYNVESKCN